MVEGGLCPEMDKMLFKKVLLDFTNTCSEKHILSVSRNNILEKRVHQKTKLCIATISPKILTSLQSNEYNLNDY